MKDITVTEACDRLGSLLGAERFDISMEYCVRRKRCISFDWTVATFKDGCEIFTHPTLRGAVEMAAMHHAGPHIGESDLQEQLNVVE